MSGDVELAWVAVGSAEHAAARALRYRVLRAPLGMPPGSEENPAEARCLHLVARAGDDVVGCLIFRVDPGATGQLMQMAVAPERHGEGVGARLVRELERRLVAEGVHEVTMHAREVARGFYERLGYEVVGAPFFEVGLPHRAMRRTL